MNPFDKNSFFHLLYKMRSNIFFYGTEINSASFIMYVEETMDKQILYRYKKLLTGKIVTKLYRKKVYLNLNAQTLEKKFPVEYDWKKLKNFKKTKNIINI